MLQSNAELARRWMNEVWNERKDDTISAMLADDARGHSYGNPDMKGPPSFREFHAAFVNAIPEFHMTVEATIEQGDDVAVRWRARGVHKGHQLGMMATGETLDFWGITWLRFSNGRIVEGWDAWNQGAVMQQLHTAAMKLQGAVQASAP